MAVLARRNMAIASFCEGVRLDLEPAPRARALMPLRHSVRLLAGPPWPPPGGTIDVALSRLCVESQRL